MLKVRAGKTSGQTTRSAGRQPLSIAVLSGGAFLVFTLALALVGTAAVLLFPDSTPEQSSAQARSSAQALLRRVEDLLAGYRSLLAGLAKQPGLLPSTPAPAGDFRIQLPLVSGLLEAGEALRYLPLGHDRPATGTTPPVSYACLELLRTSEAGASAPPAEAHQLRAEHPHFALAYRLEAGTHDGVLLLSVPLERLKRLVREADPAGGRLVVRQLLPGSEPLALAANGQGPLGTIPPAGALDIPGSIWQVAYWPPAGDSSAGEASLGLWLPLVGCWLVAGLVLWGLAVVLRGSLRRDQAMLVALAPDFGGDEASPRPPLRLQETVELWNSLRAQAQAQAQAVERVGGEAEGDVGKESADRTPAPVQKPGRHLPPELFREYDIRGVVETLSPEAMQWIGRALGSELRELGQESVIIGRDGRSSSPALSQALCSGLQASGVSVVDLGLVPTPLLYFATHFLGSDSGAMVTGSHNPPSYNGVKMVIAGESIAGERIQGLHKRIESGDLSEGSGGVRAQDLIPDYLARVVDDVQLARPLKIVIDCGNGSAGVVAPTLYRELGCEVVELFCDVDGHFPNHHPDPNRPENLQALTAEVLAQQADIGIAFDGDGDRIGVVDSTGKIIWPDRLLMLLAADILSRHPGTDVIYDVKCTQLLAGFVRSHGGRPILWKTGHAHLKAKVRDSGALIGGEFSGHIVYGERWFGFDDALYAGARLLEILSGDARSPAEVFAELPEGIATPELVLPVEDEAHHQLMGEIISRAEFPGARVNKIDGLRVELGDGWGLVRASNTTPSLVFRFEAQTQEGLEEVQRRFREVLQGLYPGLSLPF